MPAKPAAKKSLGKSSKAPESAQPPPVAPATESTPAKPAVASGSTKPAWQRNRVFRFFSSVKLAVILLSVVILASIAGTLYESNFDAKVARAYVYEATWFNLWLVILGVNLACAAFSRMPWRRHHTGFLVTHLGIIVLLIGALIGRWFGIEGTMTLFKGQPPNNQLMIDQHVLRIEENGQQLRPLPVSIIGRQPTAAKPWVLGQTPAGWKIELVDYAPLLAADFEPQPVGPAAGGATGRPAVRVKLVSKRLKQTIDNWLLVDDAEHNTLDLGLASVQLRRGAAPAASVPTLASDAALADPHAATPAAIAKPAAPTADAVDEGIIAFALKAGEQVAQPSPNTQPSGVKVRLTANATARRVLIDWRGATWEFDAEADKGKDEDLSGSGLSIRIENYWPDFVLKDGQPGTASNEPKNPAIFVRVRGKLPAASSDDSPAATVVNAATPGGPENQALVYCDDAGALTFTLKSSASPDPIQGELKPGQPINTGWADWQLEAAQVMPSAVAQTTFRPLPPEADKGAGAASANHTEGVKVRLSRNGESVGEWAGIGWTVTIPTRGQVTQMSYGFRTEALPVGLQLTDFEVERNEGNDEPAAFKSTILLTDPHDGVTDTGSCSMNRPYNYPGNWLHTFSGQTFKVSQASWNPENLNQSSVQILRDPGWIFKWIGSLLICGGIFTLFYLRPAPKLKAQ